MRKLLLAVPIALLVGPLAPAPGVAESERPSVREMEARAAEIAQAYLAAWSRSPDGAVGDVPYVYGPNVRFYGRTMSHADLQRAKRGAVRQWPIRRYSHRPGTMRITCNARKLRCASQSIIDYHVSNPATGRVARGSTTLDLGISFAGPRPVILYESGKVRGRDPSA